MRSQRDTFVPAALEADVREILLEFNRRTSANADSLLIKRAHLEVRREIMRQRTRCSLLRRALVPVFLYVTILYATLIASALDPSLDEAVVEIVCLSCYLLALVLPCAVVIKERRSVAIR
jgi:hypothetical protein